MSKALTQSSPVSVRYLRLSKLISGRGEKVMALASNPSATQEQIDTAYDKYVKACELRREWLVGLCD